MVVSGEAGAGAPHLLAVDDEVVAVESAAVVRSAAASEPASGSLMADREAWRPVDDLLADEVALRLVRPTGYTVMPGMSMPM